MATRPSVPPIPRELEGAQLVHTDAESEDIEPVIGRQPPHQLRRHVVRGARAISGLHKGRRRWD